MLLSEIPRYFKHDFDEVLYFWATEKLSEADHQFLKSLKDANPKVKVIHDLPSDSTMAKSFLVPGYKT